MSEQTKLTKEQLITRYRDLGKKYEDASQQLSEPIKSAYLRIADTLYRNANQLEVNENDAR